MKFATAHAACKGGSVHRDGNVTWKTDGTGNILEEITHASVAAAGKYMKNNARTKAA